MNQGAKQRLDLIDRIRDKTARASAQQNPFIYYLPEILTKPEFQEVNLSNILLFVTYFENDQYAPVVSDALHILNQLVSNNEGTILPPGPQMFYNSRNFFWKELGNHTNASHVIMHIINKTIFLLSLEKRGNA
jgi:hypothetical protein